MLGLKASHASWELKGLLLLPGKSLLGGGERSPEWGLAKPVPFLLLIPSVGGGAVLASASLWLGREFCRSFSLSPGGSPRSELYVSKDLGVTLGKTSWRGQLLNGIMKDKEISDIDLSFN